MNGQDPTGDRPVKEFGGCVLVKKGEELGRTNGSKDITPFPLQKRVPQPSVFFLEPDASKGTK